MRKACLAALLAAAGLWTSAAAQDGPRPDVIYGSDDRLDLYQVKDKRILALAASTVGLFEAANVTVTDGKASLVTEHYGKSYNLCKEEPFYEQEAGAFCSGSLVAPDIVMTAGHCVTSAEACKGVKFVFDFGIAKEGASPKSVPASAVYGCAALLGREQENNGADWALIKLDRPVTGRAPLKLDKAGAANDDLLFVIGHPAGLPTKVAGGAKVRDASPNGFFVANLDTYGGNSGSAVFDAKSGLVKGILVRGETDYVYKGNCRVSKACADAGCRGEDVTKLSAIKWPATPAEPAVALRFVPAPALAALLEAQASALSRQ